MLKKIICSVMIIIFSFSGTVFAKDSTIYLVINGEVINPKMDIAPQIINGRTLVPARYVAESLGATVEWNGEMRSVIIKSSGYEGDYIPDENYDYENINLIIDGRNITEEMDVAPQIIEGRTLVPARFVAENLNASVTWDSLNSSVVINSIVLEEAEEVVLEKVVLEKVPSDMVEVKEAIALLKESRLSRNYNLIVYFNKNKLEIVVADGNATDKNIEEIPVENSKDVFVIKQLISLIDVHEYNDSYYVSENDIEKSIKGLSNKNVTVNANKVFETDNVKIELLNLNVEKFEITYIPYLTDLPNRTEYIFTQDISLKVYSEPINSNYWIIDDFLSKEVIVPVNGDTNVSKSQTEYFKGMNIKLLGLDVERFHLMDKEKGRVKFDMEKFEEYEKKYTDSFGVLMDSNEIYSNVNYSKQYSAFISDSPCITMMISDGAGNFLNIVLE